MLLDKGIIKVFDGEIPEEEVLASIRKLEEGEYGYIIFDKQKNKSLNIVKFIMGYLLTEISKKLPDHPPVIALYRYFEEVFAPLNSCTINGEKYEYFDLKGEKVKEINSVVERIVDHAKSEWGIDVLSRSQLSSPEAQVPYAGAYANTWADYSRILKP